MTEEIDIAKLETRINGMDKSGERLFRVGLALVALFICAIFYSGQTFAKFDSHVELDLLKHERIDTNISDLQKHVEYLLNLEREKVFSRNKAAADELSKESEEWESKKEIVCDLGGEEA